MNTRARTDGVPQGSTHMTMFKSYTDRSDPRCYPLSNIMHLVEAGTLLCKRSGDLVYQNCTSETTAYIINAKRSVGVQVTARLYSPDRGRYHRTHRRPTILPWVLPTATSSPTITNLARSALIGWRAAYCSLARPKLRTSPV